MDKTDQKAKYDANRDKEQKRRFEIISGRFSPIATSITLQEGEKAYFESPAQRMADQEHSEFYSSGKTKAPLLQGGLLRGKSTTNSTTIQNRITRNEVIDSGKMYFTNKRVLFIGKTVVSLDYNNILSVEFHDSQMVVKYPEMLSNEAYELDRDAKFYYQGLMYFLGRNKEKLTEVDVDMSDFPEYVSSEEKQVAKNKSMKRNILIFIGICAFIAIFFHSISTTVLIISVFVFLCSVICYPVLFIWHKGTGEYEVGLQVTKTIFFWSIPLIIFCFILTVATYR